MEWLVMKGDIWDKKTQGLSSLYLQHQMAQVILGKVPIVKVKCSIGMDG